MSEQRVFLSLVSDEFEKPQAKYANFRSLLAGYLRRAGCAVHVQEDFRQAAVLDTVEKLAEYIKGCAAVVHVVGELPGSVANRTAREAFLKNTALLDGQEFLAKYPKLKAKLGDCADLTYTQWEAFLAMHYKVPLFVYAMPEANTRDADTTQATHLQRLRDTRKFADTVRSDEQVRSEIDLLGKVLADLRHILPQIEELKQRIDNSRFLGHSAEGFLGREKELDFLDDVWERKINVLSLIAWGGVGKTSLVVRWIQRRFIDRQWLDNGTPALWRYFDWTFYDQGTGSLDDEKANRTGNVGDFFEKALAFFGDSDPTQPGKGKRLAELVARQHALIVLDGLEPLQEPPGSSQPGKLLDPDLHDLLVGLAQVNPGLCLVTSRQSIRDLAGMQGRAAESKDLDELSKETAIRLLRKMQITGTDNELADACIKFDCHALSLTLLGRFLCDAHGGEIARIDRVNLHKADRLTRPERHRTAWRVLESYDAWLESENADPKLLAILRLTGLFDRPAPADCLRVLREGDIIAGLTDAVHSLDNDEWNILLKRLERAKLARLRPSERHAGEFDIDAHPLIREYFAEQLRTKHPEAFRAAHSRLFDHQCETTPHRPEGLTGLQPLYQAVTHGCLAGRQQEACDKVYVDRILRGTGSDGFYSTRKLGAVGADLGAVAAFFDEPWSRLSPNLSPPDQAWLLAVAASNLRALGRLTEAVEPMRVSGEMDVAVERWKGAAISYSNLSQLELTLGRLPESVSSGHRAIEFADKTKDEFHMMSKRTTAADALFQSGDRAAAAALFAEAERMQEKLQPEFPLLYSLGSFRYCDLLLAPAERATWQCVAVRYVKVVLTDATFAERKATIDEAERRANTVFEWRRGTIWNPKADSLLSIALDHLTLARAKLYRWLLSSESDKNSQSETSKLKSQVATALARLREANIAVFLPQALLTAALHAGAVEQDFETAQRFLAEAQLIAERGPMPLYLADIHLTRARLGGSLKGEVRSFNYPGIDPKEELAKAKNLIEHHGYWRRKEELEDAEAAFRELDGKET